MERGNQEKKAPLTNNNSAAADEALDSSDFDLHRNAPLDKSGMLHANVDIRATAAAIDEPERKNLEQSADDMVEIDANAPEFHVNFAISKSIYNVRGEDVFEWLCDSKSHNYKTDDFKLKTRETFTSERASLPNLERVKLEARVGKDEYIDDAQFCRKLVNFFVTDYRRSKEDEEKEAAQRGFLQRCFCVSWFMPKQERRKKQAYFQVDIKMYKLNSVMAVDVVDEKEIEAGRTRARTSELGDSASSIGRLSIASSEGGSRASIDPQVVDALARLSADVPARPSVDGTPAATEEKKDSLSPPTAQRTKSNSVSSGKKPSKKKTDKKPKKRLSNGDTITIGRIAYDALPIMIDDEQNPPPENNSCCAPQLPIKEQLRASWSSELIITETKGKVKLIQETIVKSTSMDALPEVSEMLKQCQSLFLAYAKTVFNPNTENSQPARPKVNKDRGGGSSRNKKNAPAARPPVVELTLDQRLTLSPDHRLLSEQLLATNPEESRSRGKSTDGHLVKTVLSPVNEESQSQQQSGSRMDWEMVNVEKPAAETEAAEGAQ